MSFSLFNRIRILNDQEFKVVGCDGLKFCVGNYSSDHRYHGVDVELSDGKRYNNYLCSLSTKAFVDKFSIHPDDQEWLRKKIVNRNKMEDDRTEIDNVEFSIFHNDREYSIVIWYDGQVFKTEFYPVLDVVLSWAAGKIMDSNMYYGDKFIAFNALKKLAKERGCDSNFEREETMLEEIAKEYYEGCM